MSAWRDAGKSEAGLRSRRRVRAEHREQAMRARHVCEVRAAFESVYPSLYAIRNKEE